MRRVRWPGSPALTVAADVRYGAAAVLAVAVIQRITARQAAWIAAGAVAIQAGAVAPAPAGPPAALVVPAALGPS
ncbi:MULTISPECIES: hypothetical protein [Streptomyces]|uniref:hypothetical protein n=1 Tax=Streptomyces TaxID=1883 RepID=UPI00160057AD|nr:hypothetical protein [Streptomyces murinus]MBA9043929.1 hypothetical protein [Streptomyces murinus]